MNDENKNEIVSDDANNASDMLQNADLSNDALNTMQALTLAYRVAVNLSKADIIPKAYQGKPANCLIALEIGSRVKMSPFMVMQNLDIIMGKPSWSSKMIIALINSSAKYSTDLMFEIQGEGDSMSCRAYAMNKEGIKVVGPKITMKMAKEEGWLSKSGSKWKTMPELMIQYRAASFFSSLHCPEVKLGLPSAEESRDASANRSFQHAEVKDVFSKLPTKETKQLNDKSQVEEV